MEFHSGSLVGSAMYLNTSASGRLICVEISNFTIGFKPPWCLEPLGRASAVPSYAPLAGISSTRPASNPGCVISRMNWRRRPAGHGSLRCHNRLVRPEVDHSPDDLNNVVRVMESRPTTLTEREPAALTADQSGAGSSGFGSALSLRGK